MNKGCYLTVFCLFVLVGCGDESENVKDKFFTYVGSDNQTYTYDDSFTIGEAFDNRKLCKNVEWSSFEDSRKRTIVQYECSFDSKEFQKFFTNWFDKRQKFEQESFKSILEAKLIPTGYEGEEELRKEVKEMIDNFPQKMKEKYSKLYIPSSAKEVYQWAISSRDGSPKYIYNDLSMSFDDGYVLTCNFPLSTSLELIYKDRTLPYYGQFIKTVRRNVGVESGFLDKSGVIPEVSDFLDKGIKGIYANDYRNLAAKVASWDSQWIYGIYSDKQLKCDWSKN